MLRIWDWIVEQFFRIQLALAILSFVNFALLLLVASDKIISMLKVWGIDMSGRSFMIIMFGMLLVGMWIFGYFLDKVVKLHDRLAHNQNIRNPQIKEILDAVREIKNNDRDD